MQKLNKNLKSSKLVIILTLLTLVLSPIMPVFATYVDQPVNTSPEDGAIINIRFDDGLNDYIVDGILEASPFVTKKI
ncbi:MAG: hypothetical protein WCX88_01175, partial [Patescibacteria group bacterium]